MESESFVEEIGDVDLVANTQLGEMADGYAALLELVAADTSIDETLRAVVGSLETVLPDIAVSLLVVVDDTSLTLLGSRTPNLFETLLKKLETAELLALVKTDDPFQPIQIADFGTSPKLKEAVEASGFEHTWISLATAVDDPTPAWLILLGRADRTLGQGELVLTRRFTHIARIAIDKHRSELRLHRLIAEERSRLAGVLHDDPIQAMTAVDLRIQRLLRHVTDEAAEQLQDIHASVGAAIERMRRLLIDLHPPTLDDEGLTSAIDLYLAEVLEPLGIICKLTESGTDELSTATASLAYRLAVESLWNTAKHAEAERVVVDVRMELGGVEVSVQDDGIGFDARRSNRRRAGHLGLSACQELAVRASGAWAVESEEGIGTTVTFRLPGLAPIDQSQP